ncbi:hypothetical protein [Roseibium sp. MMSF_3544]|uniref:hypothetical protein n=1 Tax=unclassified Roseibium TaxID=2629323 RepID=UPI00273FFE18|nr:hypothetical protein [Roseibium sp. MMSF_3544]
MSEKEVAAPIEDRKDAQERPGEKKSKSAPNGKAEKKGSALVKQLKMAAAIVAVLGTISAGVAAIVKDWKPFFSSESPSNSPVTRKTLKETITTVSKSPTETSMECIDLNPLMPNVIPHYLLNSIGSENFPYWLRIEGENKCRKKWRVIVRFEPKENVILKSQSTEFEIDQLSKFGETITPDFDLPKPFVEKISISWTVYDDVTGEKISPQNSIKTTVLPPHTVSFDLKKPAKKDLEEGYILASLGAWTLRRYDAAEIGTNCRLPDERSRNLREVDALRSCYSRLFSKEAGNAAVAVLDRHIEFPARTSITISPPSDLLKDKEANSLEAALLLMAVYDVKRDNSTEFELVLVISKDERVFSRRNKRVFVAWRKGRSWQALNMMKAAKLSFDDNVAQSSTEIGQIFSNNPSLMRKIDERGVGYSYDQSIAAAEFHVARDRFGIQGLP